METSVRVHCLFSLVLFGRFGWFVDIHRVLPVDGNLGILILNKVFSRS
jgi:hypothetical protein